MTQDKNTAVLEGFNIAFAVGLVALACISAGYLVNSAIVAVAKVICALLGIGS